jgi:hypothetical protein
MPVADYAHNVQRSFAMTGQSVAWAQSKATPATQTAQVVAPGGKSFWDNILDIVNPLQHLPVVGTIYRNITGDKMGDLEKVAGDTLYGGPIGLASSVADVAFEKITGKDFEDTVLGLFNGGDKTTAVASTTTSGAKPLNALPVRTTLAAPTATLAPASIVPISSAPVSATKPATTNVKQANAAPAVTDANTQALLASINQSGVDSDLGMRALFAYQKSMGLSPDAPSGLSSAP